LAALLIFCAPLVVRGQEVIPGFDFWETDPLQTYADLPLPQGLTRVYFDGVPLGPNDSTDTMIRRHTGPGPIGVGQQAIIPIEIVALNLVSVQPVQIFGQLYDVTGTAVPSPIGSMNIQKTHPNGGTFSSSLPVQAQLTFTNVNNPSDTFQQPFSKQFQGNGLWSHTPGPMARDTIATPAGGLHAGIHPVTGVKVPVTETAPQAFHVVRPAMGKIPKWSQLPRNMTGENIPSDVDWRDIMLPPAQQVAPNWVLADDFISNGRPIHAVRWWGSYFNPANEPIFQGNGKFVPVIEDGFAISFFKDIPADENPNGPFSQPGALLGSYFAPEAVVRVLPTDQIGWDGHRVWEYEMMLGDAHGDHLIPGTTEPDAFYETAGEIYWVSIVAENGHDVDPNTWQPLPNTDPIEFQHYWGWHTSPDHFNDVAVMGDLQMPGMSWVYENWMPIQPQHGQFDLAFEILTDPTAVVVLTGDYNGNGKVDAADYVIWRKTLGTGVPPGTGADGNGDGVITIADLAVWKANFGNMAGSGTAGGTGAPEPSSLWLIAAGICSCLAMVRRRRID
jgi:hypothetical protein